MVFRKACGRRNEIRGRRKEEGGRRNEEGETRKENKMEVNGTGVVFAKTFLVYDVAMSGKSCNFAGINSKYRSAFD